MIGYKWGKMQSDCLGMAYYYSLCVCLVLSLISTRQSSQDSSWDDWRQSLILMIMIIPNLPVEILIIGDVIS